MAKFTHGNGQGQEHKWTVTRTQRTEAGTRKDRDVNGQRQQLTGTTTDRKTEGKGHIQGQIRTGTDRDRNMDTGGQGE